jgi:hypothetical protein
MTMGVMSYTHIMQCLKGTESPDAGDERGAEYWIWIDILIKVKD